MTTNSEGQATFTVPFTSPADMPVITATATDPQGNTSEISAQRQASLEAPAVFARAVPGQPLIFSAATGESIALRDPDAGAADPAWSLTISVSAGTLALSSTAGLTGSGEGTGTLSYTGPLSAINAAVEGLTFTPAPGPRVEAILKLDAQSDGASRLQAQFALTSNPFLVCTTADSGAGSLRQVILDANVSSGPLTIVFDIPGSGVQTITPASPLPSLTTSAVIDGTSQPGYAGIPLIAIDPSATGGSDGLTASGSDITLLGVATSGLGLGNSDRQSSVAVLSGPLEPGPSGELVQYRIDTTTQFLFRRSEGGSQASQRVKMPPVTWSEDGA